MRARWKKELIDAGMLGPDDEVSNKELEQLYFRTIKLKKSKLQWEKWDSVLIYPV